MRDNYSSGDLCHRVYKFCHKGYCLVVSPFSVAATSLRFSLDSDGLVCECVCAVSSGGDRSLSLPRASGDVYSSSSYAGPRGSGERATGRARVLPGHREEEVRSLSFPCIFG